MSKQYSVLRRDRSGSQLHDMLYCLAYTISINKEYGGAIAYERFKSKYNLKLTNLLCNMLGLPEISYMCSSCIHDNVYKDLNQDVNSLFTDKMMDPLKDKYKNWLLSNDVEDEIANLKKIFSVSIHLRRGDVTEINQHKHRYTPDKYYYEIINYIKDKIPEAIIYVFSEKTSYGVTLDFSKYSSLGCILKLDTDIISAWNYFINSDIFVMSKSSFSYVPALFRDKKLITIYEKFWYKPLFNWISFEELKKLK